MQTLLASAGVHKHKRDPHVAGMTTIHTVLGAGQVGTKLARALAAEGFAVRLVRRGAPGAAIDGVTWLRGDITDPTFADAACRGASVVYNCTNPPDYANWNGLLPLYRASWDAASRAGARLVQLDSLYGYGEPPTSPFDERTPMRPCGPKGELRRRVADELFERHARGDVVATLGRASDYFGPETPSAVMFRPDIYQRLLASQTIYVTGNLDTPHGYSYTPDVATGLMVLGTRDEAVGRAWHLPLSARGTTRETFERFAAQAGVELRLRRVPRWVLRALGVVSPLASALAEMTYQWEVPYVMDDTAFRRTFGIDPTPLDAAIATTLAGLGRAAAA
jgi:nucleoside-diphosphate-sugar epimerase